MGSGQLLAAARRAAGVSGRANEQERAFCADAFKVVGNRPEELVRALRLLRTQLTRGGDPDAHLSVIAATLRTTAADAELMRLEQLGGLANAIFERIATADGGTRGLFSAEAVGLETWAIRRAAPLANST